MGKPRPPTSLPDIGALGDPQLAFLLAGRNRGAKWAPGAYSSAEEAWERNREELIRFWTRKRRDYPLRMSGSPMLHVPGPGHRPFYWWLTEAPEPRRIRNSEGGTREIWSLAWAKGLKHDWEKLRRGRFAFGVPTHHPQNVEFESERDYLKRLNLEDHHVPGAGDRNAA